jgi:dTMP kinase
MHPGSMVSFFCCSGILLLEVALVKIGARSSIILKIIILVIGFSMNHEKNSGVYITFEGIDGSGKSSAARFLYERISRVRPALLTKEPGATELGKNLRTLLQLRTFNVTAEAEFLLFASDRAQHWQEHIKPALEKGMVVISDRSADSSLAYQGYGRGIDKAMIQQVNSWVMEGRTPDLTIYLKIDYETAMGRLKDRHETTVFEREHKAFFDRISEGFDTIFAQRNNVITIDARCSQEEVQAMILQEALGLQAPAGGCCGDSPIAESSKRSQCC